MEYFDRLIEESYRGFGTSSFLDLDDLRILYYGRRAIYIAFTDKGEINHEPEDNEIHRPDSILCFSVNDVVGRKVTSPEFYANVFRPVLAKKTIDDVRRYSKDNLKSDLEKLFEKLDLDIDEWNEIVHPIMKDVTIRFNFERLWIITEQLANTMSGDNGRNWNKILLDYLGYCMICDPDGTGMLVLGREPACLFLDYQKKVDIDILPIQKNRADPRKHVRERVERMIRRMGVRRNRVAKRTVRGRNV